MGAGGKIITLVIFVLLGGITMYLVLTEFYKTRSKTYISPVVDISITPSSEVTQEISREDNLAPVVQEALKGSKGSYALVIKNLKTNEISQLDSHKQYDTGSLYKLWVMAVVFQQIEKGNIDENDVLEEDASVLNDEFNIASEAAELTEGTVKFTVHDALEQMITISHNYAALLLTEKIKLSSVQSFLKQNGFNESKVGINGADPVTTASDMSLFFEKLYKGELANIDSTTKMLSLLKRQKLNNKLPKYLPKDVEVAHKTGEIDYFSHDVGIIYAPTGDYIMVMLSKSDNPDGAEERIADTSKDIYNYFLKGGEENEKS